MITLSSIIQSFEGSFLELYGEHLSTEQRKALVAMKNCRTQHSPRMLVSCSHCDQHLYVPHSCGHRHCPHCQARESQQWLERQLNKRVPANYFPVTFTLPRELRALARWQPKTLYTSMIHCAWQTLKTFSHNDSQLQGLPGAITVLHTHSRQLGYHPHVHLVIPAATIDPVKRLWRTKTAHRKASNKPGKPYLFNHKALAKVFRARLLDAIKQAGLVLPRQYPQRWVVDCKSVGSGDKALVYLGRYLYRGVIQEMATNKDILACQNGQVTFRYQDRKTRTTGFRTVAAEEFLRLILQHVLPKGFRRARNFGFLHPNSKRLIGLLQLLLKVDPNLGLARIRKRPVFICRNCGASMRIIKTMIPPVSVVPQMNSA